MILEARDKPILAMLEWIRVRLMTKHGISTIVKNLEKVEDYVHSCYLKETFAKTYKEIIQPMLG